MTTSRWGNSLWDSGFTMIPNLLLDKQRELNISDDELLFIIKVMRHHENFKLHDKRIDEELSSKTLQRRRQSLKEKGYLHTTVYKYQEEDGTWRTDGILYDFSGLTIALNSLIEKKETEKEQRFFAEPSGQICPETNPKVSTLNNTNNNTNLGSSIENYKKEFKNRYNKDYIMTREEKYLLSKASEEFIEAIPDIFEFTDECLVEENITPRLNYFLKVDFRLKQLLKFHEEKVFYQSIEERSEQIRKEAASIKYSWQ